MGGIKYYKTETPDPKLKELEKKIELYNKPGTMTLLKKDVELTNGKGIMRAGNIIVNVRLEKYSKDTDTCNLHLAGVYLFDGKEKADYDTADYTTIADYVTIPANKLDEYLSIEEEFAALTHKAFSHREAIHDLKGWLLFSIIFAFSSIMAKGFFDFTGYDRFGEGSKETMFNISITLCIIGLTFGIGCLSIIIYRKIMLHKLKRKTKDRLYQIAQDIGVEECLYRCLKRRKNKQWAE